MELNQENINKGLKPEQDRENINNILDTETMEEVLPMDMEINEDFADALLDRISELTNAYRSMKDVGNEESAIKWLKDEAKNAIDEILAGEE